jgi:uncharacterized membrane protein YedE/YeeE
VAFVAGVIFAAGLGLSGMTDPRNVLAFLDVTGAWDPSLALVMAGAIGVHALVAHRVRPAPASAATARIDRRLILGAALFGLGWGVAGFCPGPAIVSLASFAPATLAFVAAMVAGMLLFDRLAPRPVDAPAVDD